LWDKERADRMIKRHESENRDLEDSIRAAYDTGRIPGMEQHSQERGPSLER
jgi:hypothetical protein